MEVKVNNRLNFEVAIRSFRKKSQREGIVREAKLRKAYEKPSERSKRKAEESLAKTRRIRRRKF